MKGLDCLQSTFFLKICLVLDLIQRDCKPRCYYIGNETRQENKRLLAVYERPIHCATLAVIYLKQLLQIPSLFSKNIFAVESNHQKQFLIAKTAAKQSKQR